MLRGQPEDLEMKHFWRKIWKINTIPRVKTFIWKCIHSILSLNGRIARILPYINKICPLCGKQEKTLTHIFMNCDFIVNVLCYLGVNQTLYTNSHSDFHCWLHDWFRRGRLDKLGGIEWADILAITWWQIWKTRCDLVFRKIKPNPQRTGTTLSLW